MTFAPVPAREYAIVWEVQPNESRGALFEYGMEQRIVLRRTWQVMTGDSSSSFLKLKQFRKVPVIVSLHPTLARTFVLPFRMVRKKSDPSLQPEELQVMLREFLSKTTFEMRRLAGESLNVEELDAILLDARLTRLLADGLEVRDDRPLEGRRLEGFLEVIFTTREVFHDLHDLLHSAREVFFTERGPAALAFLSRHLDQQPVAFLDLEAQNGWLFKADYGAEEILEKLPFQWGVSELPAMLAKAWGLSPESAKAAYAMFARGGFSEHVASFARALFGPLEESLDQSLNKAKLAGSLYVRSGMPLAMEFPAMRGKTELQEVPFAEWLERSGLKLELKEKGVEDVSLFLMPFLAYYYYHGDPHGHRMLTRHIHWISA